MNITIESLADFQAREATKPGARRRISGIIAPYGQVVKHDGKLERFERGLFTQNRSTDADGFITDGPMPVLYDEGHKTTLGVAVRMREMAEGLWAEFELANTARNDEVVDLAEMGALHSFSSGWADGRFRRESGVIVHTDGDLKHAAITSHPSYSRARVTAIRERANMDDPTEDPKPDDNNSSQAWESDLAQVREDIAAMQRQNEMLESIGQSLERREPVELTAIRTPGQYLHTVATMQRSGSATERREAEERLQVATQEVPELRAAAASGGSGSYAGGVPEIFMGPMIDRVLAGSPFLNALERVGMAFDLPDVGLNIHRPRVNQGTVVAWEGTEGEEGGTQAQTTEDIIGGIKAVKGRNRLTMQAAERTSPGAIDALLRDQGAALMTEFNRSAMNGTGTLTANTGEMRGVLATVGIQTAAMAAWTAAAWADAIAEAETNVWQATNQAPLFWVMHSRRFSKFRGLVDGNDRPLMTIMSPASYGVNTIGSSGPIQGGSPLGGPGQPVAEIGGYPVVVDNSTPTNLGVGTNEDVIQLVGAGSFELYRNARRTLQFQSPDDFQTTYGIAKMGGLIPTRESGVSTISGPGLV